MPNIRTATTAALAALTLSLAACGGDDGGGKGGTLSKKDLQSQATSICNDVLTKFKAVKQPDDITDAAAAATWLDQLVPLANDLDSRLKALKPGDAEKADYDAFTTANGKVVALLGTARDKAKAKDVSGLQDLQQLSALGDAANKAALKLDLKSCAE
jgi:hypothetical protein